METPKWGNAYVLEILRQPGVALPAPENSYFHTHLSEASLETKLLGTIKCQENEMFFLCENNTINFYF